MNATTKPAGVKPYQKTESQFLADMLCQLFADRGIPYHRAETTKDVPLMTDHPDDDYGWTKQTTYYIDTTPEVAAILRRAAVGQQPGPAREVAEQLRVRYTAALDAAAK